MDKLLTFIEANQPQRWMVTFEGNGEITLEYFPDEYIGDKEEGTGIFQTTGTIDDVVMAAKRFIAG